MKTAEIVATIRRIDKLYERAVKPIREKHRLTQNEADILFFLHNNPRLDTASQITENRLLPKANVSQAVDSLMLRGFLEAQRDARDRRRIHLSLTKAAGATVGELLDAHHALSSRLFSDFSEDDLLVFDRISARLSANAAAAPAKK